MVGKISTAWKPKKFWHRLDLTKDQRDEHIRRYAELLEAQADALRQVRQNGAPVLSDGRRSGPQHEKGVAKQVAEDTGLSIRTVQRALRPAPVANLVSVKEIAINR